MHLTLIQQWQIAKQELEAAKQKEIALRLLVVEQNSPPGFSLGSKTVNTQEGKLKLTLGENYSVAKYADAYPVIANLAAVRNVDVNSLMYDPFGGKTLFQLKLDVSVSLFKACTAEERMQLAEVITVKPATPSVEFIPAK